jgi:hypothetical protein
MLIFFIGQAACKSQAKALKQKDKLQKKHNYRADPATR